MISTTDDRACALSCVAQFYEATQTIDGGGAAYIFDVSTGTQIAKLQPRDRTGRWPQLGCYWFGAAVSLADGVAVVGAPRAKRPCAA